MIEATSNLCPKCRSRRKDLVERGGEWARMGKSSGLEINFAISKSFPNTKI